MKTESHITHLAGLGVVTHQILHDINNFATVTLMNLDLLRAKLTVNDDTKGRFEKMDSSIRDLIRICKSAHDLLQSSQFRSVGGREIYETLQKVFGINLKRHEIDFSVDDHNWDFTASGHLTEFIGLFYICIVTTKERFYEREDTNTQAVIKIHCEHLGDQARIVFSDNAPQPAEKFVQQFTAPDSASEDLITTFNEIAASLKVKASFSTASNMNHIFLDLPVSWQNA